ncbi:caspase family protein [Tropicimonas sp. TH_r6]|uniref:caspase family protein n=1 Tax=Tropicimonas sp. TH_r6 TaxID=3082085 RepID=UPI002952A53A|nr:caspase family protein [Tropicimonas sp. TH_r6]MDV7143286.1 caspase family protein [Tropicimonas sp. TH_r6]
MRAGLIVAIVWGLFPAVGFAERHALIVGNAAYDELEPLSNTHTDAEAYRDAFEDLGYSTLYLTDLDGAEMWAALDRITEGMRPGDEVAFVFSGHGWSDGKVNYLVPTDAPQQASDKQLKRASIPLRDGRSGVLDELEAAGASLTLAIVDACRDNPFRPPPGTRSTSMSRGLVPVSVARGSFVIFSAGVGEQALDGLPTDPPGKQLSVFTRAFLPWLRSGAFLEDAISEAQLETASLALTHAGHQQHPAYYDQTMGKTCLVENCSQPSAAAPQEQVATTVVVPSLSQRLTDETPATDGAVAPNDNDLVDVQPTEGAEDFFQRGMELMGSDTPDGLEWGVEHLRRAATLRHSGAMTELGAAFAFGRGIEQDGAMALDWQSNAAKLGNARAMLRIGLTHLMGHGVPGDESEAARWIFKAVEFKDPDAMYLLAMLHEDGIGVSQSMEKLVFWLEQAAAHGHLDAMYLLGDIYLDGEDGIIAKDSLKTEYYWLAAAKAGHRDAMEDLSEFLEGEDSVGVEYWARAAQSTPARPGYMENPTCLSDWECYDRESEDVASATPVAPAPVPKSEAGQPRRPDRSPRVIYAVQDCDRFAASPRDPDRADLEQSVEYADLETYRVISECLEDIAEWPDTRRFYAQIARGYFKAGMLAEAFDAAMTGAELGSGQAMSQIGIMYKSGHLVAQDPYEALTWLEKAGRTGNVTGMHFAAGMHLHAEDIPYNPQAAANWFKAAANLGSPQAYKDLGILYDTGEGVPYDPVEAAANLLIALSTGSDQAREVLLQDAGSLTPRTRIEIQRILNRDGTYFGALDGSFGPQTDRALRSRILN